MFLNLLQIKDPFHHSACSHLCLAASETSCNCYCDGSNKSLPLSSFYCHGDTLLAAYQNSLFVVGLLNDSFSTPIIHKSIINMSSISTITYNSIDGKSLEHTYNKSENIKGIIYNEFLKVGYLDFQNTLQYTCPTLSYFILVVRVIRESSFDVQIRKM